MCSRSIIVFIGPSLPLEVAKRTLPHADYRPPIKRDDFEGIVPGTVVGIIDGVFDQTLAISPGEIREAINRGVVVYGAASMGALRAAEIPRVIGVGRIFEMYRAGTIERDDEVALLFAPDTYQPITVPLVNLRYAVERLVRSATIGRDDGNALIDACSKLHFKQRTYKTIFENSKLSQNRDVEEIIQLLRNFDLKRNDAQFLLETLADLEAPAPVVPASVAVDPDTEVMATETRVQATEDSDAPIMVWESGDSVILTELIRFLKMTGNYEHFARNAISRFAIAGAPMRSGSPGSIYNGPDDEVSAAQSLLDSTRLVWGWESPEESHVTMRDLGLGLLDVSPSLEAEATARRVVAMFARYGSRVFMKALRSELWLNDLSLKREVMRLGALQFFARRGAEVGPPTEWELSDAKRSISRFRMAMQWSVVCADLNSLGVRDSELDEIVRDLALARRAARPIVGAMYRQSPPQAATPRAARWRALGLGLESSIKAEGSNRFRLAPSDAVGTAQQIAKQIGIVRIGMIGELDTLGIHVAQAFGERSGWSASFSSGKAETREGARIGSIMEEVEIHAQDAFEAPTEMRASFARPSSELTLIDPLELGLPYDSRYRDTLEMEWSSCVDLLNCRKVLIPSACLMGERIANDIYYSPRLGGKIFSSSGLGSGFSLAEATVHAAAECIERHALRLVELELDNPSSVGRQFWFVDHESLPETPRRIVEKYRKAGMCVRILDITSDIAVPTFYVRVYEDPFMTVASMSSDGFACHPDPEVGLTMALLEAAQTKAGVIAGGREDYSLQARSLGRHERPRTMVPQAQVFWFSNDRPVRSFQETVGLVIRDIFEELEWMVDRVQEAGFEQFLVTDLTIDRIQPAYAVRIIIPGIETTNPLFTGARAQRSYVTFCRDVPLKLTSHVVLRSFPKRHGSFDSGPKVEQMQPMAARFLHRVPVDTDIDEHLT